MNNNEIDENEKALLLDHDYDGIQELDHRLPNWWLVTFWGGIIFAVIYIGYYIFGPGPELKLEYVSDYKKLKEIKTKYLESLSVFNEETFSNYSSSDEMVSLGGSLFARHCAACHKDKGAGDIGPNLTDEYWLYAEGTPETIYPFILSGNPAAGMPAWAEVLTEDELYSLTAYVMSIQGITHESAKEPQGEHYPR